MVAKSCVTSRKDRWIMSRVAKKPITLPSGVEVSVAGQTVTVKGKNGALTVDLHPQDEKQTEDKVLNFAPRDGSTTAVALAGTIRALVNIMVSGGSTGFVRMLDLVGVGYRALAQGKVLNLTLGYSH